MNDIVNIHAFLCNDCWALKGVPSHRLRTTHCLTPSVFTCSLSNSLPLFLSLVLLHRQLPMHKYINATCSVCLMFLLGFWFHGWLLCVNSNNQFGWVRRLIPGENNFVCLAKKKRKKKASKVLKCPLGREGKKDRWFLLMFFSLCSLLCLLVSWENMILWLGIVHCSLPRE